jgi:hypothetical protein
MTSLVCQRNVHPGFVDRYVAELLDNHILSPSQVALSRSLAVRDTAVQVAIVAHELGHVATTEDDFAKREALTDSEWASDACADYYAYRWGFARQIRKHQRTRDKGHHGGLPGDVIEIDCSLPTGTMRYRVTRRFYYRLITDGSSDRH